MCITSPKISLPKFLHSTKGQKPADYSDKFQDINISLDFQIHQGSWRRIKRVESKVTQMKGFKGLFLRQASFSQCGPHVNISLLHRSSLGLLHWGPLLPTSDCGSSSDLHSTPTFLAPLFCSACLPHHENKMALCIVWGDPQTQGPQLPQDEQEAFFLLPYFFYFTLIQRCLDTQ